jgi:flagellar hook-length control protein FliK
VANAPTLPNEHDVNLHIVQSMRMQFRDGIGEAVLKLNPEHLGSVSISLKVENGGLKANVQADMPAVRQWLESQQDTLRSALAEHGLRLDQFDVEPDAQRQQADDEGQREQSRKRQAQKREAEQPVFEVVV